jgi:hypothetical protein
MAEFVDAETLKRFNDQTFESSPAVKLLSVDY